MAAPKGHPPYNVGCETGRPPRYTKEFGDQEAIELEKWSAKSRENIFIEDFCIERDFPEQKLVVIESVSQNFREAYEKFKSKQKSTLFKGGLSKKFNYNMCALILSHNHKVNLKTEQSTHLTANITVDTILEIDGGSKDLIDHAS